MQIYGPSYVHGPQAIGAPHTSQAQRAGGKGFSDPIQDELQISSQGDMLSKLSDVPDIRQDKVAALRAAIADGSYESEDKLSGALDRLLDEIG